MRISPRSIEEVRENASIAEVASEFTALKRQGTNLVGLCPYPDHSEKSPSFSVSPEKNFYHCFGCKKGGDSIKLVMELKSFSFVEAVSYLAERFGIELKFEGRSPEETRRAEQRAIRRRSAHKALAAATAYYHKYLLNSPAAEEARRYLKSRGFERSTIVEFRLGYAPPRGEAGFSRAARHVGLGREALDAAGLLSQRGGERFVDRLMFPISDRRGRIVGFGARALGDAKPKYLNSPETDLFNKRFLLYGFPQVAEAIRKEKAALVVEGYTDVLMLYQSGIKNAVATLGTAITASHLRTLSSYADKIYLLFDPDEAGERATQKARTAAKEAIDPNSISPEGRVLDTRRATIAAANSNLDLRVLRLTEDPADWLLRHPPREFVEMLSGALSILDYTISQTAERILGADTATRARVLNDLKKLISELNDPVSYWEAIRVASHALKVDAQVLQVQVRRQSSADVRVAESAASAYDTDPLLKAGRELLAIMLARPDLAARPLREGMAIPDLPRPVVLEPQDFSDENQARIFSLLVEHAGEDFGAVLSDERARPWLDDIAAIRATEERLYPSEASLRAAWFRLAALSRAEAKGQTNDFDEKYRLHAEIKNLNRAAVEASDLTLES